ncbi:hypothetical protein T265_06042 [Opisthorchis viverrini]|uniref:Uncharacterized protein n=1 Tax=Opisthorchis viverrini TaxID=6198 RepID=A0A075AEI8_OPIVI|nr:hypothetical protein T265_06042 [Opisthorchis viverrini]KER26759.1 hypothetical protein T265_06042 [Opisthorchis viverrini]
MAREILTREQQAGFRPGRGCVDQIFTLRQVLEQRHTYKRPTILVFLDFRGAFDSFDRSVLLETLARQGMSQKFIFPEYTYSVWLMFYRAAQPCSHFEDVVGVREDNTSVYVLRRHSGSIAHHKRNRSPTEAIPFNNRVYIGLSFKDYAAAVHTERMAPSLCLSFSSSLAIGLRFNDKSPCSLPPAFVCTYLCTHVEHGSKTRLLSDKIREHNMIFLGGGREKPSSDAVASHLTETSPVIHGILEPITAGTIQAITDRRGVQMKLTRPLNLNRPAKTQVSQTRLKLMLFT